LRKGADSVAFAFAIAGLLALAWLPIHPDGFDLAWRI